MKAYKHAVSSARKFGGKFEDYMKIHVYMDSSKAHCSDNRHRMIFHSSFGIFIVADVFGETLTNSEEKIVSVRDIAEQHVMEDIGWIPTLSDYMEHVNYAGWMEAVGKPRSFEKISEYRKNKTKRTNQEKNTNAKEEYEEDDARTDEIIDGISERNL